jgi:hypothetical protein
MSADVYRHVHVAGLAICNGAELIRTDMACKRIRNMTEDVHPRATYVVPQTERCGALDANISDHMTSQSTDTLVIGKMGDEALDRKTRRGRLVAALIISAPLLFGIPVALGIAISVIRLIGTPYPDLGWATTIKSDAEELYLGHTLFQNPAHGYTGTIYTPLFPTLVSILLHIHLWNGWPLLVTIGASVSLMVLVGRVAYVATGPNSRVVRILGAVGIGGIAYWCVSSLSRSLFNGGNVDQLAWAFALFGLIAVADLGSAPSRGRIARAALLLSAALWTKQTTVIVAVTAFVWVWGLALFSALRRQAARQFTAVLVGVNLTLLLVLNLLTDGWEFFVNFEVGSRHALKSLYGLYITEGLRSGAVAFGLVGAIWLICAVSVVVRRRGRSLRVSMPELTMRLQSSLTAEDPGGRRALLLGLFIPLGFAMGVYAMRKQGTSDNEFIGVVWALGLLIGVGWRFAQNHRGAAVAASVCVALYFALAQLGPIRVMAANANVSVPALEEAVQWPEVPEALRLWAGSHTLYTPPWSDLNVPNGGPLYPDFNNIADLLASGSQPLYLVHALLDRRFEGVMYFPLAEDPYTAAYGKWEENYLWKLDEVIAERYAAEPGLPPGVLGRRPGPERAAWMRDCFGPFDAARVSFRIRHGGGFWCSFAHNRLSLVRTPARLSEVVTTQPVAVAGSLAISLGKQTGNEVDLALEGENAVLWEIRVTPASGQAHDLEITSYAGGALLGSTLVPDAALPGGRLGVKLRITPASGTEGRSVTAGVGEATIAPPTTKAPLEILATAGAEIDLDGLNLEH